MNISTVCVCGGGTMGSGIAQVAAAAGFTTLVYDPNERVLDNASAKMKKEMQGLVDKGRLLEAELENVLQNIRFTSSISHCVADIIIEAIIEKAEAKMDLFQQLATINSEQTLFASNTSSLSITHMAQQLKQPGRLIGMHFFNPAPQMKLVEIVTTEFTSPQITETVLHLAARLNKQAVVCRDAPGFIVNRVARPYYIESLRMAEEGKASFETIDKLLEAAGFKMGPFKLMDLIGNDINYAVSCSIYEQLSKPERLRPSYLQQEKTENGELGRKTGKGYYSYDAKGKV